jgi:hypothetical protein
LNNGLISNDLKNKTIEQKTQPYRPSETKPNRDQTMEIKIGTFNLFNLVAPGVRYYNKKPYSKKEFAKKSEWIGRQLQRMDADSLRCRF